MKTVFFLLLSALIAGCVPIPLRPDEQTFTYIVEIPNTSKDRIFSGARTWIAQTFRSAKAVIQYENTADGTLVGNGIIDYPCSGFDCVGKQNWLAPFTVTLDVKDNKARASFSNLRVVYPASHVVPAGDRPVAYQDEMAAIKPALIRMIDDMSNSIKIGTANANW
jgi:hypothetical protein